MAPEALDLEVLAPVIGYANCRALAVWFAGKRLIVPVAFDPGHPLALLIGAKHLRALVDALPGFVARIPSEADERAYKRLQQATEGLALGTHPRSLAEALNVSQRRVEQMRVEAELRGWLSYASRPGYVRRAAGGRTSGKPEYFLGTGEVFQTPPLPSEAGSPQPAAAAT